MLWIYLQRYPYCLKPAGRDAGSRSAFFPRAPERRIFVRYSKSSSESGDIYDKSLQGDDVWALFVRKDDSQCDTCGEMGTGLALPSSEYMVHVSR